MPGARRDLPAAAGPRVAGSTPTAPGRVAPGVVALALTSAALVAILRAGSAYWLCVPAGLAAASLTRTRVTAFVAAGVVVAAAATATLSLAATGPAPWAAVIVPLASLAVLEVTRARAGRERADLRAFALTDPLTRVANRRLLLAHADHELARHRRTQRPLALVMLGLDGFKALNDRYGHAAGDDLLRDVAAELSRAMRAQDTVARLGGDEFCILAPETDATGAAHLCERVDRAVASVTAGTEVVSGSAGAAVFPGDGRDIPALMRVADERLLAVKRARARARPADRDVRRAA